MLNFSRRRQIVFQHFRFAGGRRGFGGWRVVPGFDGLVKSSALDGRAAGFADGFHHRGLGLPLRRFRAGHVEDVFLDDGAVQIVRAVAEGDLRELEAEADPVGGEVIKVVEVEAADGDGAERVETRGRVLDLDLVVVRLIGQRHEAGEAVRLVLERAELAQMIHAVGE